MAIETDDTIYKFGTQDEVSVTTPAAIDGNNGISLTSDIDLWTNDDDAPMVAFVFNGTYSAVPDTGVLEFYCTLHDIEGTNDEPDMDASNPGFFLGSITPDQVTTSQHKAAGPFALPVTKSSQVYRFHLVNRQNDAAHDISSGWSLWVTPVSYGPHP